MQGLPQGMQLEVDLVIGPSSESTIASDVNFSSADLEMDLQGVAAIHCLTDRLLALPYISIQDKELQ